MTLVTFKLSDYNLTPNAHITFYPTTIHNDSDVLVGKTPFGVPFTTNTTVELESTTGEWVWRILISDNLTPIKDGFYRVPNQDTIPFTELTSASPLDIEPDNPWLSMARSTVSWAEIVDGELILSRTDGKTINVGSVMGEPGEDGGIGKSVTIAAGAVTKLPPGSQPTASLTGSLTAKTLNLGLVTGDTGEPGLDGSNVLPTNAAILQALQTDVPVQNELNTAFAKSGMLIWAEDPKYASVQAALNAAQSGDTVMVTRNHTFNKANFPKVPVSGITINHAPGVELFQSDWGYPVYECFNVDSIRVQGRPKLTFSGVRGAYGDFPSFRGEAGIDYCSGIWSNGSDNDFDVKVKGFVCGVKLSSWTGAALSSLSKKNNRAKIIANDCLFGIQYLGQVDARLDVIAGDAATISGAGLPHAIYGSGNPNVLSDRVIWEVAEAYNIPQSTAFVSKHCNSISIPDYKSTGCNRILSLVDVVNVEIGSGVGLNCVPDASGNTSALVDIQELSGGLTDTISIGRLLIERAPCTAALHKAAIVIRGSKIRVGSLSVRDNITDAPSSKASVWIDGKDITISESDFVINGFESVLFSIGAVPGVVTDNVSIGRIKANKYRELAQVHHTATNVVFDYNPADLRGHTVPGFRTIRAIGGTTIGYKVARSDYERSCNVSGGLIPQTDIPDPFTETRTHYKFTDTQVTYIPDPQTFAPVGMTHEIAVENGTGGTMGVVNWNAIYTLSGTYVAPAVGMTTVTRFRWNGAKWTQTS